MRKEWTWLYPFQAIVTFALAQIGWVFFRAADLPQSLAGSGRRCSVGARGICCWPNWHIELIADGAGAGAGWRRSWTGSSDCSKAPTLAYASALALMLFCIEVFGVIDAPDSVSSTFSFRLAIFPAGGDRAQRARHAPPI